MILSHPKFSSFEKKNELIVFSTQSLDFAIGLKYNQDTIFSILPSEKKVDKFKIETFKNYEIIGKLDDLIEISYPIHRRYLEDRINGEERFLLDIVSKKFKSENLQDQRYLFVNEFVGENSWERKLSFVEFVKDKEPFTRKLYKINLYSHNYSSEPFFQISHCPDTFLYHLKSTLNFSGKIYPEEKINHYLNKSGFQWIYKDVIKKFDEEESKILTFSPKKNK